MNEKIVNVFFREKPIKILLNLKNSKTEVYASSVAKKIDCTYSHVVKILQEMEKANLVNFKKMGRLKLLTLTSKGTAVADLVEQVINKL